MVRRPAFALPSARAFTVYEHSECRLFTDCDEEVATETPLAATFAAPVGAPVCAR